MQEFNVPDCWGLSEQQEAVIGYMLEFPGEYITTHEFCDELYGESLDDKAPAPAKLRVLIQRCRELVGTISNGRVEIETRRGKGWRITKKGRAIMAKIADRDEHM